MQENDRTKMCPHCEGSVPIESSECPYCGHSMIEADVDDSLSHRYRPPYEPNREVKMRESAPETNVADPFAAHKEEFARNSQPQQEPLVKKEEGKQQTLAILLLTLGAQALTIGLLILFFSTDGQLTLQWSSRFWYIYCLVSLPFLFLGRIALKRSTV